MIAKIRNDNVLVVCDPIHGDTEYVVAVTSSRRGAYWKIYYSKEVPNAFIRQRELSIGGYRIRINGVVNGRINHMGMELVFNGSDINNLKLRNPVPKRLRYRIK